MKLPGGEISGYRKALRYSEQACQLEPKNGLSVNTLGVDYYRLGEYEKALATLLRPDQMNKSMHNSGYWRGHSEWTALRSAIRVVCLFGNPESRRVARVGHIDRSVVRRLRILMPQADIVYRSRNPCIADLYPPPRRRFSKETRRSGFFEMKSPRSRRGKENGRLLYLP